MTVMRDFEIMFSDLKPTAQEKLLRIAGICDPKEANWDVFPVSVISFHTDDDVEDGA